MYKYFYFKYCPSNNTLCSFTRKRFRQRPPPTSRPVSISVAPGDTLFPPKKQIEMQHFEERQIRIKQFCFKKGIKYITFWLLRWI